MTPQISIEKITPAKAKRWLAENNPGNRKLRRHRVRQYAEQMAAGKWKMTGDPIRFAPDGRLLDGQHRLAAIIDANTTIETVVIRDVDESVFAVLDSGMNRTPGDAVHFAGVENSAQVAGVARFIIALDAGLNVSNTQELTLVTRDDIVTWSVANATELHPAISVGARVDKKVGGNRRAWAVFLWYAKKVNPYLADQFIAGVEHGVELQQGDPRLALRNWLMKGAVRATARQSAAVMLGTIIRVWNAWMKNKPLTIIRPWASGDDWPSLATPSRERLGEARRATVKAAHEESA